MINNNNDTNNNNNNNNNQDRQDPSGGNVEHGVPEDPATLRHSASPTKSISSSSSSRPMSNADRVRALARSQEDEAVPHSDEVGSDRVSAAHREGGISQTSQVMASLRGIPQGQGQTLVSTYVVNTQSIAAGSAYHLTVPPRSVELGDMRQAMNHSGTFGKGALEARTTYMERFYPEIGDNNWRDQCHEIALQTNFADYSMARRLILIEQQEAAEENETTCPLFTWTWSDAHGGPTPYFQSPAAGARHFFRGPYDPDCVWNLADNVITSRGEASLLSILDIANALRCMNGVFQMSRVLSGPDC